MYIQRLKVRPRKQVKATPCYVQLSAMLGCWAATSDLHSAGPCQDAARALYDCMRTAPMPGKQQKSTINYHLRRLGGIINK
ncbi:hypothetical protein BKA93DRAFT_724450 [Sparassis latifolia]